MRRRNVDESRRERERELLAAQPSYEDVVRYSHELFRGSPDVFAAGLELDRVLKSTGYAGRYYAEKLLSLIPRAWRTGPGRRGPDVAYPHRLTAPYAPVIDSPAGRLDQQQHGGSLPELVVFVDRPMQLRSKAQLLRRFARPYTSEALKPYLALNTPDGHGSPFVARARAGGTFGGGLTEHTTPGIEIGYRATLRVRPDLAWTEHRAIDPSGSGELEARGAHFYGFGRGGLRGLPKTHFKKLKKGWSDLTFLKAATSFYEKLLARANELGPVAALTQREEEARTLVAGPHLDWRESLNRELINTVTRAGEIAGLPHFPFAYGRGVATGAQSLADRNAYTPEVLARWHQILDVVIPTNYVPHQHHDAPMPPEEPEDPRDRERAPWMRP